MTKEKPAPIKVECKLLDVTNLEDAFKKWGNDVVLNAAKGAVVISLQAFIRRHIDKGTPAQGIQAEVDRWKPDVRSVVKATAFEKATSQLDKLSTQERSELIKRLQAIK